MRTTLARRLRAVAALAVLLAVIVGVPVLLLGLHQVPHRLPSLDQVLTVLRSRDTGQLAGLVLAAGVWICWALFTASTVAELLALARARPVRTLPGLGAFQRPAALLIAAVILGFTAAPATGGHATAAPPVPLPPPIPVSSALTVVTAPASTEASAPGARGTALALATQDRPPPAGPAPTYQVRRRDTLWALAERYLGDPLRYPEIIRLNPSAVGPDNEILPGTVLVMPADASGLPAATAAPTAATGDDAATLGDVTVQPGDTLWGLTQEFTGSGRHWPQAWQLNRGRPEPDGAAFTDPSLIQPGWTLTIPEVAGAPPPATTDLVPAPAAPGPAPAPGPPPSSTEPAPSPTTAAPTSTTSDGSTAASTTAGTTDPRVPLIDPPSPTTPSPALGATAPLHADSAPAIAAFAGAGLLLAGVSLTALTRYRRRQFRHRRPGRLIPGTPPQLVPVEQALHATGDTALPDVTWLDQALRSLVHAFAAVDGARLPDVLAARLTDDTLTLVLTQPAPVVPEPWTVEGDGTRWSIKRSDALPYDADRRPVTFAPYPALASMGRSAEGEHWLVDLERAGAVSFTGNRERCLDLARFLAAELAHNTWSEMLHVTLVGFGRELIPANPDRLTSTDDLDQAIAAVTAHIAWVTQAQQSTDVDVLTGRLRNVAGDAWAPHVVLIASHAAPDHAALSRLFASLTEQTARSAVAVLVVDEPGSAHRAGWQLTLDDRGMLHLPALGLQLIANQVPADEATQLAQLLTLAADPDDRPIPPAHGHEPWDAHADACGGLRSEPEKTTSADQPPPSPPARDLPGNAAADRPPHDAAPPPQDADSSAKRAGLSPRNAGLSPQAAGSSAERAGLSPQGSALSPQGSALSPQGSALSPQGSALSPQPAAGSSEHGNSVLPLPPRTYLNRAATTQQDLQALAPVTGNTIRRRVEAADPTLDADLADWADPHSPRPKLTLLGPVTVRAQGHLPERHPRRNFYTESVAYLATRPTGATLEQYASAIWPHDPDVAGKTKVRQAIAIVRAWLGIDPNTGRPYLPPAATDRGGRYQIDGILVDAELFRRLRLRGQARGAEGITDLQAALNLVTGVPFDHLPSPRPGAPGGYSWLIEGNTRLDHEYAAMIVDVAHTVATHHLATSEPVLAAAAARVALRAGSFEDVPLLDLVAACDAQGHRAEADAYVARILANHDAEVEEDLPPRTAQILYRRQRGAPPG